jgi:hypothetical protein
MAPLKSMTLRAVFLFVSENLCLPAGKNQRQLVRKPLPVKEFTSQTTSQRTQGTVRKGDK